MFEKVVFIEFGNWNSSDKTDEGSRKWEYYVPASERRSVDPLRMENKFRQWHWGPEGRVVGSKAL